LSLHRSTHIARPERVIARGPLLLAVYGLLRPASANLLERERSKPMSKSASSVLVFGVYLVFLGLGFLIMPNTLLPIFGVETTEEVWIRVVAMLVLILAYYYIRMAREGATPFFRLTVHGRASVILFFAAFVLLDLGPPSLILFGAIDLLGAGWTAWALRSENQL
jgi:hypothetical protein